MFPELRKSLTIFNTDKKLFYAYVEACVHQNIMPLSYTKFKWSKYYCYLDYLRKTQGLPLTKLPDVPNYDEIWGRQSQAVYQSEILPEDVSGASKTEAEPVMHLIDANEGESFEQKTEVPDYVYNDATTTTDISEFLSRYVKIASATWNESDGTGTNIINIEPWREFFSNSVIKRKLQNYSFIRCNLRIKVLVNASPFYYGMSRCWYIPKGNLNGATDPYYEDSFEAWQIPVSQLPNIEIFPGEDGGGELQLPFLNTQQFIRIGIAQDFGNMGQLILRNVTALRSANGVTGTGVNIIVYARAEDVILSGATIDAPLQAKAVVLDNVVKSAVKGRAKRNWRSAKVAVDEYSDQPASAIASAVAAASGQLTRLPIIGKFATVAEMVSSSAAKGLRALGFTNLPNVNNVEPVKLGVFPPMANSEISYPFEPLGLDPKIGLTIDNSIVGLDNNDQLAITNIATRCSYWFKMTWDNTDASDTALATFAVTPQSCTRVSNTHDDEIQQTPSCWVSQLFNYWRGDMIYTIKVIASPFHKGRLRITYDPSGSNGTNIANTPDNLGATFNTIMDIGKQQEIKIRIPYMQHKPWAKCLKILSRNTNPYNVLTGLWTNSTTPAGFTYYAPYINGQITIRVLNKLTSPVASAPVNVLVYSEAADNLEFANPGWDYSAGSGRISYALPQSEVISVSSPTVENPSQYLLNHGEVVTNLRQLLRRHQFLRTSMFDLDFSSTFNWNLQQYYIPRFPPLSGYNANSPDLAVSLSSAATKPYNWQRFTTLEYICNAFAGVRGSVNYTFNPVSASNPPTLKFTRDAEDYLSNFKVGGVTQYFSTISLRGATSAINTSAKNNRTFLSIPSGSDGSSATNTRTQPTLNVSWPMYNNDIIEPTRFLDNTQPGILSVLWFQENDMNANSGYIDTYVSIGPDFNTVMFLCCPTVFVYDVIPAAA